MSGYVPTEVGIRESHLQIMRSGRVCAVGSARASETTEIWYVIHGYGQLADRFLSDFESIASRTRLLVAPEGLSRFYLSRSREGGSPADSVGASWMTRHDRDAEIQDYVRYLNQVARSVDVGRENARRILLGFSQGAHTAARWAVLGEAKFDRLILWGSGLPRDLPPNAGDRLSDTRVVLVRGAEDPLRDRAEEEKDESWLGKNEVRYEVQGHPNGHQIIGEVLERLVPE